MKTRKEILVLTISVVLGLLLFIPVSSVIAGNPGTDPGVEHLRGPAVMGTLTFEPFGSSGTTIYADFNCKGDDSIQVSNDDPTLDFALITEENLLNQRYSVPQLAACSGLDNPVVIVHKIFSYIEAGSSKTANVLYLFVVGK